MQEQWNVRVLLLEGPTDISFFVPILKRMYGFQEAPKELYGKIKIGKNYPNGNRDSLSKPVCIVKNGRVVVLFHVGGRDKLPKALRGVLTTLDAYWDEDFRPRIVGVVRDIDTEHNVFNWVKSVLRSLNFEENGEGILLVGGIRVVPFGLGNVGVDNPNIEEKRELELLLTALVEKAGTLSEFERSLEQLKEDAQRKLKPKDVMHVLAIAKDYDGDAMSGLYRKFIEELIRAKPELIEELLEESGLRGFLDKMVG
ncbi:DUF3226 domain-containing protein [Thermococcus sp. PK]|uniref:DUF3226 domain-containing protein n=1 Tax=Thermococcus sp. PK TaxID=913025 RepID=UPI0005B2B7FE|nr:DUF3226 domain-containing protein [Thermococcus sp. PK]